MKQDKDKYPVSMCSRVSHRRESRQQGKGNEEYGAFEGVEDEGSLKFCTETRNQEIYKNRKGQNNSKQESRAHYGVRQP